MKDFLRKSPGGGKRSPGLCVSGRQELASPSQRRVPGETRMREPAPPEGDSQSHTIGAPKKGDGQRTQTGGSTLRRSVAIGLMRRRKLPIRCGQIQNMLSPKSDPAMMSTLLAWSKRWIRRSSRRWKAARSGIPRGPEPRDRAWDRQILPERRDPTRCWSKQVELIRSGEVQHKHEITGKVNVDTGHSRGRSAAVYATSTDEGTWPLPLSH